MQFIKLGRIKNDEPVFNLTRSNAKSRLKWIWFPVLKVGSTAIRGMINRHLRPEWKENDKDDSYNPIAYKNTLLRNESINGKTPIAFPEDDADDFYKFAFVRNPWDRMLSCWCDTRYVNKNTSSEMTEQTPFRDFVKSYSGANMWLEPNKHMQMQQAAFMGVDMDYIGRLESAHAGFSTVCDALGVQKPEQMLQKNVTDHKHYSTYYDDETREIVSEIYKDDIVRFGYEFEMQ